MIEATPIVDTMNGVPFCSPECPFLYEEYDMCAKDEKLLHCKDRQSLHFYDWYIAHCVADKTEPGNAHV